MCPPSLLVKILIHSDFSFIPQLDHFHFEISSYIVLFTSVHYSIRASVMLRVVFKNGKDTHLFNNHPLCVFWL
jgi:hypothetical protein